MRRILWLWRPDATAAVVFGRLEAVTGHLFVRGTAKTALLLSTADRLRPDIALQAQAAVGGTWGDHVRGGVILRAAWLPTAEGDNAQTSLAPFVRLVFGTFFVRTELTMNLDGPFGFAFDAGGVWGLHLRAGAAY